ncbi:hypothetical protein [Thiofilum flexile]|uniref:hypothetical protein n=1 Tax=Thiofilum flexile TaxID=125627 RepID=UPI0003785BF9|nr:hypothetical protein [Thiofilum flexile]
MSTKYPAVYLTLLTLFSLLLGISWSHQGIASEPEPTTLAKNKLVVRITQLPNTDIDKILYFALLKLALEKSGYPYTIEVTPASLPPVAARIVSSPEFVNVVWQGTSREFEEQLLPVRIPLLQGLLGYRVFLIRKERQAAFQAIKSIADLSRFRALLGSNWSDVNILEAHKLPVILGKYSSLMPMLEANRGDYYPRSILEINQELDPAQYPDIGVEQSLLLYYPLAIYFFVAPNNQALHDALYHGLEIAVADGSYHKLLMTHPLTRDVLKNLHLLERRLLKIDNPFLTDETRAALAKYSVDLKTLLTEAAAEAP